MSNIELDINFPPLFDDMSDLELASMSNELSDLLNRVNELRRKQLYEGGITDDEVREGIKLLSEIRVKRAGKQATPETAISIPLEKMF